MKNVLEFIENSARLFPDKTFVGEENSSTDYASFEAVIRRIGSFLCEKNIAGKPAAVLTGKNAKCLELAFGAVEAGGFYTIIDIKMPSDRIARIFSRLSPAVILTDRENLEKAVQ